MKLPPLQENQQIQLLRRVASRIMWRLLGYYECDHHKCDSCTCKDGSLVTSTKLQAGISQSWQWHPLWWLSHSRELWLLYKPGFSHGYREKRTCCTSARMGGWRHAKNQCLEAPQETCDFRANWADVTSGFTRLCADSFHSPLQRKSGDSRMQSS